MTVTYEVGGSSSNGKLDIDFYVSRPIESRGRARIKGGRMEGRKGGKEGGRKDGVEQGNQRRTS